MIFVFIEAQTCQCPHPNPLSGQTCLQPIPGRQKKMSVHTTQILQSSGVAKTEIIVSHPTRTANNPQACSSPNESTGSSHANSNSDAHETFIKI